VDEVQGAIVQRDEFIVHDHLNRARLQPALHLRNVFARHCGGTRKR
jgi:hypothetical protein